MSRHPQYEYEYPINHQEKYYIEEHEGFVADYSDSDCIQDSARQTLHTVPAPPHLSESFGRHTTIVPVKVIPIKKATAMISKQQSKQQFLQQPYYDRNINPAAITQRPCFPTAYEPIQKFYPTSTASHNNTNCDENAFRNGYCNVRQFECRNCQIISPKASNIKRFPVTVRTPRYYKKQTANAMFKRPSALCLPVAAQPDPAVIRRPKKSVFNETFYGMQETQGMNAISDSPSIAVIKQICNQDIPHRVDSQGDSASVKSTRLPPFDALLEQMEKGNIEARKEVKTSDVSKLTKYLKPRIPVSVKARLDKAKAKSTTIKKSNVGKKKEHTENKKNEDDTAEVSLEKLLNQLKKCEQITGTGDGLVEEEQKEKPKAALPTEKKEKMQTDIGEKSDFSDDEKFDMRSFNYQDISSHLFKSQSDTKYNSESAASIQDLTNKMSCTMATRKQSNVKKPLDDHCALELHKSKSYIVNLIDRALSRELGTIPCNRNQNEFDNMNPKKAMDTVNRHLGKPEKSERDLSIEITSALTDSLISNVTSPEADNDVNEKISKNKLCYCNSSDEPIYIKQLKQLRWGHLRHIQREVKRLEDLERFLDSCSITTIPEI